MTDEKEEKRNNLEVLERQLKILDFRFQVRETLCDDTEEH